MCHDNRRFQTLNDFDESVRRFLDAIEHPNRQRDAETLLKIMSRVTGEPPLVSGTGVGFGTYHYRYESGREGDAPAAGFAPRKPAAVIYLMDGVGAHADLLERLGPHTSAVGCLYVKDLAAVDLEVLETILARSYATLTAGTYRLRAREGGRREPTAVQVEGGEP